MRASTLVRRTTSTGLVIGLALTAGLVIASPAAAVPPTTPCNSSNHGVVETVVNSAEINPRLTHFISINITEGTTGERTETLTVMDTVTTTIGVSTEIDAEAGVVFAKASAKVGFSLQRTWSSTSTETTSMRWTFNEPGYYGLYKGTRAVSGNFSRYRCSSPPGAKKGWWLVLLIGDEGQTTQSYTTFANVEAGTIQCGDTVPPESLREKARLQLGC